MTNPAPLSSLFKYKAWANAAMYKALLKLEGSSAADEWQGATKTMNHMYVVDRIFAGHLTGAAHGYSSANMAETPSLGSLHEAAVQTDAWYVGYVAELTPAQLAQTIHFTFTDGLQGSMSREEILLHVATHGSYHRGAVSRMFAERGLASPPDTMTRFLHSAEPERRMPQQ